jgi:hypothetical protein
MSLSCDNKEKYYPKIEDFIGLCAMQIVANNFFFFIEIPKSYEIVTKKVLEDS